MTSPGGRIQIRVDPDLRSFGTRLSSGLTSAAGSGVSAFASAATTALKVAGAAAAVGLGAAIRQGLNVASFTEQAQISFETLLGSASRAKDYLSDLQKFAASTPFELPGVVQSARQLLGVGQAAETVIPTLTAWGDAAGALGLSQEQFQRAMLATTQAMSKGKVQAEELMQITEAGIPVYSLLSKALGLPVAEIQNLASEGKLLAKDVFPALERQMNADYGGAMTRQAQTLSGVWSTAKDNLNLALRDGVQPLAAGLKVVLPDATSAAANAIRTMGLRGSEGLLELIKRGQELRETYGPELGELGELAAEKWRVFTDLLSELGAEVAPSLPHLIDSLLRIAQVGAEVGDAMLPALKAGLHLAGPAAEALAGALGIVADVLESIEPVLPVVVAGFLALRGISAATGALTAFRGTVGDLGKRLENSAINAGVFTEKITKSAGAGEKVMTGMGRAASAVSRLGAALPIVGLGFAAVGYAIEKHQQQVEADTQALVDNLAAQDKGGTAALQGAKGLDAYRQKIRDAEEALAGAREAQRGFGADAYGSAVGVAAAAARVEELKGNLDNANAAYREQLAALTPLEQAQAKVTEATNNALLAQQTYGDSSPQYAAATDILTAAQARLEAEQRRVDGATRSATDALLAQAQAAIAGANADLAASMANTQLSTAMETYKTSLADGTLTTVQRQQATDAMTQSAYSAAQAAAAQALAHSTAATEEGKQKEADAALLASLQATAKQLGANTPAAITTLIGSLQSSGVTAVTTSTRMRDLGLSVTAIPGSKDVRVNAPTEDQRRRLADLGLTVTNIPGSKNVIVSANTAAAQAAIDSFIYLNSRRSIQVKLNVQRGTTTAIGGGLFAASGGYIRGPGTGTSDSIPAWLSNGEYVIKAASTARARRGLDAANVGDWAAAAREFSALAERQSRTSLAAAGGRAAAVAGRFAAGGYVDAQLRASASSGSGPAVDQRRYEYNLTAVPSLPTVGQLERMQRKLEVLAGA